jgi:hypothetical protein
MGARLDSKVWVIPGTASGIRALRAGTADGGHGHGREWT